MSSDAASLSTIPAPARARRWRVAVFFAVWTLLAVLAVWWLTANARQGPELLIEVGDQSPGPALARLRAWCARHLEVSWAYAWVIFAPYVLWLGAQVPLERRGLPWRVALLLSVGTAFVVGAQSLTSRVRPRVPTAITLSTTAIAHEGTFLTQTNIEKVVIFSHATRQSDYATTGRPHLAWSPTNDAPSTEDLARQIAARVAPVIERIRDEVSPLPAPPTPAWSIVLDALAYFFLLGLAQAVQVRRRLREREQQAALLEGRLNQARLRALQAQLQPHFLFNSLNGIAALIRSDPARAEEMVTSLSELLRLALSRSRRQRIPLRDELEFLDRYLEIQQMRFGERLRVERELADEVLDCLVPSLLLQPLVENAVRHGLEPAPHPGVLRISAQAQGARLHLTVADNGVGLGTAARTGTGLGVASVRERLAALYGTEQEFDLRPRAQGGTEARIVLPRQSSADLPPGQP